MAGESLRERIEALLYEWEVERSAELRAAEDTTLPEILQWAAGRAAECTGWFIEELDRMYTDYIKEVNA